MVDVERAKAEELILAVLRAFRGGAEVVVQPDSGARAVRLQWPPPSGLYGAVGVPEVPLPVPAERAERGEREAVPIDPYKRQQQRRVASPEIGSDFSKVTWPGAGTFLLNSKQAAVVRLLFEAFMDGQGEVREAALLAAARKAGSDATRLRDVFRHNPAWGGIVLPGPSGGTYMLAALPDEDAE